uniref:ARID domain-containing protein n=1 Tax=Sphaeramia orbicularis TaxID=375764 RepID=A0A673CMR3_9TELE
INQIQLKGNTEEQFLKDLYLFMKKRDTPIERIPHLGFKQLDLFVMFNTVKDLGGYHQVTSQQLWKQVYNTLGGNPRSTSAATCTRRHYEKLLLPYECHIKGLLISLPPQPKHIQYINFRKEDDGQRPAKRKPLPLPLHQVNQHLSSFSLNPSYHKLFYPPYPVPAPYGPIPPSMLTPHRPPAPQPFLPCPPAPMSLSDRITDPLEQLRFLAKQYETSSGLTEPLNLSVKATSSRNINSNPASSFSPPSSSKNPKFLNKPSPLYTVQHPTVERNAVCETEDGGAGLEATPLPDALKGKEGCAVNLKTTAPEDPPLYDSAPAPRNTGNSTFPLTNNEVTADVVHKNSSPITDVYWSAEERDGSPEVKEIPGGNGGRMEIEIPLSMLDQWLRLCGPRATVHRSRHLLSQDEQPGQRNSSKPEVFPTNLTCQMNPREANVQSVAKDLRLSQRNIPNPTPPTQPTNDHHASSQCNFTSYRSLPSGGIQKNAASRDVYLLDQWDNTAPYSPKPTNSWEAYDGGIQALPVQAKIDSSPLTAQPDFAASKSYNEVADQGRKERPDMGPPAVLMLNPNSTSLLHLTTEEVMKLKKIISSTL